GNQGEVVGWDNACAGQQDDALGEAVVAAEPVDEVVERPGHLRQGGRSGEHNGAAALDRQVDGDLRQRRHGVGEGNDGAEGAGVVVDLGLRQVERVLALDVARTHVVADRVADQLEPGGQHQGQFRLRHVPLAVAADEYAVAGADDAPGGGLEEQL